MCFSAPASFIAAGIAGGAGIAALTRVQSRNEVPLAAMPIVFAIQQTIEGFLWLSLPIAPDAAISSALTEAFLLLALVFWPVFAPLSILAIEPDPRRRAWIAVCLAGGLAVAIYFVWSLGAEPRTASIDEWHIVYSADPALPALIRVLYPVATCLSLLLSSHSSIRLLGGVIFIGSVIAYWIYWNAFTSVWCFFAAAASGIIVFHFGTARRRAALPQRPADAA